MIDEYVTGMMKLFPRTIFNEGKPVEQLEIILEETAEAKAEYKIGNRNAALLETIDILQATMSVLYSAGYTQEEIANGVSQVLIKNYKRGYYKE